MGLWYCQAVHHTLPLLQSYLPEGRTWAIPLLDPVMRLSHAPGWIELWLHIFPVSKDAAAGWKLRKCESAAAQANNRTDLCGPPGPLEPIDSACFFPYHVPINQAETLIRGSALTEGGLASAWISVIAVRRHPGVAAWGVKPVINPVATQSTQIYGSYYLLSLTSGWSLFKTCSFAPSSDQFLATQHRRDASEEA